MFAIPLLTAFAVLGARITSTSPKAFLQSNQPVVSLVSTGGARVLAEQRKGASFALAWVIRLPNSLSPSTAHMLEHVLVSRDHGQVLEQFDRAGVTLKASTTRFQISFVLSGPSESESQAVQLLGGLIQPLTLTQEDIERETQVLLEEKALRPSWGSTVDSAYFTAWGLPSTFADVAPQLDEVLNGRTALLSQVNMAVCVVGGDGAQTTAQKMIDIMDQLPPGDKASPITPKQKVVIQDDLFGVYAGPVGSPYQLAVYGVAQAISARLNGALTVVTPQAHASLICILAPSDDVRALVTSDRERLVDDARDYASKWADELASDLPATCQIRTSMLLDRRRWGEFVNAARTVSDSDIDKALSAFEKR